MKFYGIYDKKGKLCLDKEVKFPQVWIGKQKAMEELADCECDCTISEVEIIKKEKGGK